MPIEEKENYEPIYVIEIHLPSGMLVYSTRDIDLSNFRYNAGGYGGSGYGEGGYGT